MNHSDPYVDPGSGVLLNHLGVTDEALLRQVEAEVSALRDAELKIRPLPGLFDLDHLCGFHRRLFGDLYPFAGTPRRVDIARTARFAHWRYVVPYATSVFDRLRAEWHLAGLDRDEFLDRFVHYFAEVNAVHPFREGNGRAQRAFFRQMALHAGWRVDFAPLDVEKYGEACRESLSGSTDTLRELFDPIVQPA
ncbi:Fic family protein [Actinosynnema sp. NPDC020468]|uniref:Fic/DOC family protein n=1 Tax=Actinosynnema sp. NPDC020468 TaxID=3154488 RepID=UPI003405E9D7